MVFFFTTYVALLSLVAQASCKPVPVAERRQAVTDPSYWLADITHQGISAFNPDPSTYTVFRNVKDFGAAGEK